jgi:hypothetical protein
MVCVAYLVQDWREIHAAYLGVREVQNGKVITSDVMQKNWHAEVKENKAPFPEELKQYVAEVKKKEESVRAERHKKQDEALDKLMNGQLYAEEEWHTVLDLLNGLFSSVHADDNNTLAEMARFIEERPQPIDMHARKRFVEMIGRKNYKAGLDSVRLEASRNSRDGQNWASERAAIDVLGRMGTEDDIEVLRKIILVQGERHHGTLLRAAFPAFATLVVRYHSEEPEELAKEIIWVKDHQYPWFKKALPILQHKTQESTEAKDPPVEK